MCGTHPCTATRYQSGFTLIEVLIGVLLLSLAIMTFSAALSQTYRWQIKQQNYEIISMTANSLVNTIVAVSQRGQDEGNDGARGELNGIQYQWQCSPLLVSRNRQLASDSGALIENAGKYNVFLESCVLQLEMNRTRKKLQFFRSRYSPFQG